MSEACCPFLLAHDAFARLCEDFLSERPQVRTARSKQGYRLAPWAFRRWMFAQASDCLNEKTVTAWLLHRTSTATVLVVAIRRTR